ncbi:hypothetical protein B566_EDAN004774 [Ephemera danica]|nr:hypothetical protein B566_EDAN004774 [Ephemera danica]
MLLGNGTRECLNSGFWSGVAPTCKYVDCGAPGELEHGTVRLEHSRTTHGGAAVYECSENYTIQGIARRVCGDNGAWSGDQPQCLFAWCPDPPEVAGGRVLTCGLGGTWSTRPPECRFVDCGAPANTFHGRVELLNATTTAGSLAQYQCDNDYWLVGQQLLRCGLDGKWSSDTPLCELITCEEPEVPSGGYIVGYDFNVHSSIEYHCEPGHLLKGPSVRTCTSEGEWSAEGPNCIYVDCGKVPALTYGTVGYKNDTTYVYSELEYNCVRNYRLAGGEPRRKCQEDGNWSGTTPRCEVLSVTGNDRAYGRTLIRTAAESAANSAATYKISAQAKYRCERGHKLEGEGLRTCEENGVWSGEVPQCIYVDCGAPEGIEFGKFNLASNATYYGVVALYECNKNFKIDGYERRMCLENGSWSHTAPKCHEVVCNPPEQEGGLVAQVSSLSIGGVARYTCPKGSNMEGNDTRVSVDCQHPGSIENGRVVLPNLTTTFRSAAEYHCIPLYERIGPYLRRCTEDGVWSGDEPRCDKAAIAEGSSAQQLGLIIGVCAGVVLFLLLVLGLCYMRLNDNGDTALHLAAKKGKIDMVKYLLECGADVNVEDKADVTPLHLAARDGKTDVVHLLVQFGADESAVTEIDEKTHRVTPVKDSENVQGAERKEETRAAVMSYATLSDPYNRAAASNIYENIAGETNTYDTPYESTVRRNSGDSGHYEPSPTPTRADNAVTINGVATEAKMSSRKTAGRRATTKKRAQRATSNVFAMFDQAQIQEFKEAFNMIDQNRDGFVDKEDLHDMLASLGPINFTMFLTLFGERLQGTDPEEVIKNAFGCFDEENLGHINEERLRELLTTMGDRFTDEEVDEMYREAPIKSSMFDYIEFTRILKHGAKDKDEQ